LLLRSTQAVGDTLPGVRVWPVYLWGPMHADSGETIFIGGRVTWDVCLTDGEAEGWPAGVLVDTTVQIESDPGSATGGLVARTPELVACWRGHSPPGSEFRIRAGLQADLFNPPVHTPVTGTVRQIMLVTGRAQDRSADSAVPWELTEVRTAPSSFASVQHGLLILLAI
jgi:hypothetical protein